MSTSSAQELTKFIRNKGSPLKERLATADQLLKGSLVPHLPKRDLIIVEWLLASLSSDPQLQNEVETWELLARGLDSLSAENRTKVLLSFKSSQILLNSLRSMAKGQETAALIMVATVTMDWPLSNVTSSQAVEILLHAAKAVELLDQSGHTGGGTSILRNWLISLYSQLRVFLVKLKDPEELFDAYSSLQGYDSVANLLLKDLLGSSWFPNPARLTENQCKLTVDAIIAAKTDTVARLEALFTAHPNHLESALEVLPERILPRDCAHNLLISMIDAPKIPWRSVFSLLESYPSAVAGDRSHHLIRRVSEIEDDNGLAVLVVLRVLAKNRDLYDHLSNRNDLLYCCISRCQSETFNDDLCQTLKSLSVKQMASILSVMKTELLPIFIKALTFDSAATESVTEVLKERFHEMPPLAQFHTVNLGIHPSAISTKSLSQNYDGILLTLQDMEQNGSNSSFISQTVEKIKITNDQSVYLFQRFYNIFPLIPAETLELLLSSMTDFNWIVDSYKLFEHTDLASTILKRTLEAHSQNLFKIDFDFLSSLPQEAIPHGLFSKFWELAWGTEDIKAVATILSWDGISAYVNTLPKSYFIKTLNSVDNTTLEDALIVMEFLSNRNLLTDDLVRTLDKGNWKHMLVLIYQSKQVNLVYEMAASDGPGAECLVSIAAHWLANKELGGDISDELVGSIAARIKPDNVNSLKLFKVMVDRSFDCVALTAYFVKSEHSFGSEYVAFVSGLAQDVRECLIELAIEAKQFCLLQYLLEALSDKSAAIVYFGRALILASGSGKKLSNSEITGALQMISSILAEDGWLVTQFAIEQVMHLVSQISRHGSSTFVYRQLCTVMSKVILFHRHRLSGRAHLLNAVLFSLLLGLVDETGNSHEKSACFARLVKTLCEGQLKRGRGDVDRSLTSAGARARKTTGRLAGGILINYIQLSIRGSFSPACELDLRDAVFALLSTMSASNVKVFTAYLDSSGRALFKQIYSDFSRHTDFRKLV